MSDDRTIELSNQRELDREVEKAAKEGKYVVQVGPAAWVYEDPVAAVNKFMLLGAECAEYLGKGIKGNQAHISVTQIDNDKNDMKGLGLTLVDAKHPEIEDKIMVIMVGMSMSKFSELNQFCPEGKALN